MSLHRTGNPEAVDVEISRRNDGHPRVLRRDILDKALASFLASVKDKALVKPLPEMEGSGFHVTRKTYATRLLKNGVGADMVAEALGQCGTSSVHRYLSLDTDRMRMCPLSLSECSIGGWSHEK